MKNCSLITVTGMHSIGLRATGQTALVRTAVGKLLLCAGCAPVAVRTWWTPALWMGSTGTLSETASPAGTHSFDCNRRDLYIHWVAAKWQMTTCMKHANIAQACPGPDSARASLLSWVAMEPELSHGAHWRNSTANN